MSSFFRKDLKPRQCQRSQIYCLSCSETKNYEDHKERKENHKERKEGKAVASNSKRVTWSKLQAIYLTSLALSWFTSAGEL
jgi:hypothetical protein